MVWLAPQNNSKHASVFNMSYNMFEFKVLVKQPRFVWNHQDSPAIHSVLDPFGGHMKSPQSKVTLCNVWIARHLSFSSWTWKRRIHAEVLCDVCAQNSLNSKKNGHTHKVGLWKWEAETITWGSHAETCLHLRAKPKPSIVAYSIVKNGTKKHLNHLQ